MTKRERKQLEKQYEARQLARDDQRLAELGIDPAQAAQLRVMSRRLRRLFEADCSLDDGRQEQRERSEDRIEARARKMMPEGVELYVQGDCRGCSLYVIPPSARRPIDSYYNADGIALA
jgi:hypothetical protein